MTQAHREDLSAGVDGELANEELRFLLRRLDHDASLRSTWARYHVARDSLRRQLPPLAAPGFAARVMRAIELEPAAAGSRRMHHWLRWSTGGAIAAGVAVAALMMAQPTGEGNARLSASATPSPEQTVARVMPTPSQPTAPAAVPPWLSGDTASQYSQQAAATLGESYGDATLPYASSLLPYRLHDVRAVNSPGGYLLLVDPQSPVVRPARQASVLAQ
jgi:Negative regulator of sigma E activity